MQYNGVPNASRAFFTLEAPQMLRSEDVTALIASVKALPQPPALIILDTLARCFVGGEENAAKDVGLFVDACRDLKQQTGAAILIVHHTGKGTSDTFSKPTERGSSALRGAADVMIRQEIKKEIVIVSNDKQKDEEEFKSIALRIEQVDLGPDSTTGLQVRSAVLVATGPPSGEDGALNDGTKKLLDVLSIDLNGSAESGPWCEAISKRLGKPVPSRTFHNWKRNLIDRGAVEPLSGRKGWYQVVESASANEVQKDAA